MFGARTGLFMGRSLRTRVMATLNAKIDQVERRIKEESKVLQSEYEAKVVDLQEQLITDKEALMEVGVQEILGKVI